MNPHTQWIVGLGLVLATGGCLVEGEPPAGDPEAIARIDQLAVGFTDCVESIGVTLVATGPAEDLVPAGIVPVGAGTPVTPLVVRTANCGIAVNGHAAHRGSIVQVGLVIVPPGVPGDIDNYTLGYVTDDERLTLALRRFGVGARRVRTIDYDVDAGGAFAVTIGDAGRFELSGTVTPSTVPVGAFHANWWQDTEDGLVEMATAVPAIAIGGADLALSTNFQPLAQLLGSETTGFPIVQQFNGFAGATMTVTRP